MVGDPRGATRARAARAGAAAAAAGGSFCAIPRPSQLLRAALVALVCATQGLSSIESACYKHGSSFQASYTGADLWQNLQTGTAVNPNAGSRNLFVDGSKLRVGFGPSGPLFSNSNQFFYVQEIPMDFFAGGSVVVDVDFEPDTVDTDIFVVLLSGTRAIGAQLTDNVNGPNTGGPIDIEPLSPGLNGTQPLAFQEFLGPYDQNYRQRLQWEWYPDIAVQLTQAYRENLTHALSFASKRAFSSGSGPLSLGIVANEWDESFAVLSVNVSACALSLAAEPAAPGSVANCQQEGDPTVTIEESNARIEFGPGAATFLCDAGAGTLRTQGLVVDALISTGSLSVADRDVGKTMAFLLDEIAQLRVQVADLQAGLKNLTTAA